jgi:hypothetical protein
MPAILATQETEMERIVIISEASLGKKFTRPHLSQ